MNKKDDGGWAMESYMLLEEPPMFSFFQFFILLTFFIMLGIFIYRLINVSLNMNATPTTITVTLIGKDQSVRRTQNNFTSSIFTFIFEDDKGERLSFDVGKKDYHQFVEGDKGQLTYQRKMFKSFERIKE